MAAKSSAEVARRSMGATLGVFLSRLSGILRTQVVNAIFGASASLDGFYAANRFPNALRDLFADGALSAAFTKVYVDESKKGIHEARQLIATTVVIFGLVTVALATLGMVFAAEFLGLVTGDKFRETGALDIAISAFRWLAFYLPLTMLSAVAMSVLSVLGRTLLATFASAFFNLGMIVGALVLAPAAKLIGYDPVLALAWGVLLGGVAQFSFMVVPLWREGLIVAPWSLDIRWRSYTPVWEMLRLMAPRALVQGASQIALMINTFYASQCGPGALTYITNATLIVLVPVGLFGVASGFASLPLLTEAWIDRQPQRFRDIMGTSLAGTLWLATSSALAFALFAFPMCIVLFRHGRFTTQDCLMTSMGICAYMGGMVFNAGSKVVSQGFFALNNTWLSMINACVYLMINATLSSILAPRLGIVGLGISNSTAGLVDFSLNIILLLWLWRRSDDSSAAHHEAPIPWRRLWPIYVLVPILIASGVSLQSVWHGQLTSVDIVAHLPVMMSATLALTVAGGIVGLVWLWVTTKWGPEDLRLTISKLFNKVRRQFIRQ